MAWQQGVRSFVTFYDQPEDIADALRAGRAEKEWVSPPLQSLVPLHIPKDAAEPEPQLLSRREQQVADLVAAGCSNAEIAERLFIGETTVKSHVGEVLRKMGLKRRSQVASLIRK